MTEHPGDGASGAEGRGEGTMHPVSGAGNWLRGLGVVVVAVVIGALLMPSATRAPLQTASTSATTTTTTATGHGATTTTTTTLPAVVPGASAIHVLVANGTSISHLAAGVADYLHSRGYAILTPTNASSHVSSSEVFAASGQQGAAGTVVSVLGLAPTAIQPASAVAPVASTAGATVVVIAGPDLARLAPGSTTATTAA